MTYVLTQPQAMAAAAADVAGIGSAINEANATAVGRTTGVLAAAADEVSAATATLFNSYAQEYQAVIKQAGAFHNEFAQLLAAAGNAYAETEAAASGALLALTAPAQALLAPLTGGAAGVVAAAKAAFADPLPTPVAISLIMTGTGTPVPPPQYMNEVYGLYISPNFTTTNLQGLTTPEQLYPLTGVKSPTLDQSVSQGVTILNNSIMQVYSNGITPINVFGYSQSAVIASQEMPNLVAAGIPSTDVNFVLIGDPMTPNGGLLRALSRSDLPEYGCDVLRRDPGERLPDRHLHRRIRRLRRLPAVPDRFALRPQRPCGCHNCARRLSNFHGHTGYVGDYVADVRADNDHLLHDFQPRTCRCWTRCVQSRTSGTRLQTCFNPI